ncbi:MAG: acyclic terpene utilization AtuA family protein [Alphaproteobacteria bacterium]|nr:acyclic terpene utilization AtuA family protein [Alphaproteobacteria bacterium]
MSLGPHVIAVDAGSTDPGPHYLGSGEPLVSRFSIKRELTDLIVAARRARIPVIVGSAGGSGSRKHVNWTLGIVREIAAEQNLHFRLAHIYSDIDRGRLKAAIRAGEIRDFEAGYPLTEAMADGLCELVAQMGHEPMAAALDQGADVIIGGRACDDSTIAAFPIWRGADPGLSIHMGKILECGAFSAEPFGMDVMLGTVRRDDFVLEPGSLERRASVTSVAAHTLYERENPFRQAGPGHEVDLSDCTFELIGDRQVRVAGSKFIASPEYWVKLEGVRHAGFRSVSIAGIRCPTMIPRIDGILAEARRKALAYFSPETPQIGFHVYGRDGVMQAMEPEKRSSAHELGLVIDVVAANQELAHGACHHLSGMLLHTHYPGQYNTAGNLAFPYSPSEIDAGPVYEFAAYHLMKARSPTELFPIHIEDV